MSSQAHLSEGDVGLTTSQPAVSQEYFGEFLDELKGEFIFVEPRPTFKLASEFRFVDPNGLLWRVPPDTEVDGASIPQPFWSFIGGPFEDAYVKASVIHDYYCDEKTRTEHDTHRNFYYGMRAAGVEEWKADFMYWVVGLFGPTWTLTVSEVKDESAALPAIDLNDPDTRAAALSKASTVARSLKTTDGKVLDISATGQVGANPEEIARNAKQYRVVFATKDFVKNPAQLGVLSQWSATELDQVKPWERNQLPKYHDAIILKPSSVEEIESGKPFRLDPNSTDLLRDRINLKALKMKSFQER